MLAGLTLQLYPHPARGMRNAMKTRNWLIGTVGLLAAWSQSFAADFDTSIVMQSRGAATYYVPGEIMGVGPVDLMVDTGSGYTTINEETLAVLEQDGRAKYVKDLVGILANGSRMVVKVYKISAINIGGECWLNDVEAAVFPGRTRLILGLSALTKASPFIFSVNPPKLVLSNCVGSPDTKGQTAEVDGITAEELVAAARAGIAETNTAKQ